MVHHLGHTPVGGHHNFVHTPDIPGLLRREGVDTARLTTDNDVKRAIAGLSDEAKNRVKRALGISDHRGPDIDDLCGYERGLGPSGR